MRAIIAERNKRIQEEKQQIAEAKRKQMKEREENMELMKTGAIVLGSIIALAVLIAVIVKGIMT